MLVQNLFDVLPVLALVGLGLNSLEALPIVAAHTQPARAHHRHLAEKARLASNLGARAKQPGQNLIIRRGPNGKACRVRGESKTAPAVVSSTFIDVTSSVAPSAIPTTTEVAVAFETTAIVPVSSAVAPSQYQAPQSQAPETSPAPAPSQAPAPSNPGSSYQGGGSGWANSGSKLGIAWPNGDWAQPQDPNYIANYIGSKASWYYTWSPYCVKSADDHGLEFVPMLWGVKQIGDWHSQQASWPNTVKNALFFNEPNDAGQAHIDASNAVQYWMNDFLPVRQRGIKLGAAAVTNAPSGIVWVREMIETCVSWGNARADCTPDFIPIHWYATTPGNLIDYAKSFWEEFHIPLWITEYACQNFNGGAQCDEGQVWNLHQSVADWFDKTDYVQRYSPFGVMQQMQGVNQMNALMNPGGDITALGTWYIHSS